MLLISMNLLLFHPDVENSRLVSYFIVRFDLVLFHHVAKIAFGEYCCLRRMLEQYFLVLIDLVRAHQVAKNAL